MKKVLLVSGDNVAGKIINKTLIYNNILLSMVTNSALAWKHLVEAKFEFIIIDTNLEKESGLSLYRTLRQTGNHIPVMMLGEGDFDKVMLKNLSHENYDFIMKPIRYRKLKMKVNSFMKQNLVSDKIFTFGDLEIDTRQKLLVCGEKLLQLSTLELDVMMMLARKSGQVISPQKIAYLLESEGRYYKDTANAFISSLKKKLKKLETDTLEISFIDKGYKLTI